MWHNREASKPACLELVAELAGDEDAGNPELVLLLRDVLRERRSARRGAGEKVS